MEPLEKLRRVRIEKLEKIKKLGIDPYPAKSNKKQSITTCLKSQGQKVQTAGRIVALRSHGGSTFADLVDESGKIQLFFSDRQLSSFARPLRLGIEASPLRLGIEASEARRATVNRQLLALLDIGDFISVLGKVDKTQAGQITIFVESFSLLTKSLRPIPKAFYGLKDIETRLRKRYLDFLTNQDTFEIFLKKNKFWQAVREYLIKKDFLEVETPALEPIPGGADATPFVTHYNALNTDFYLRISLELYQKRLLVGGFEKIFEIGKIFRNEGIDAEHLQDYLQMEFYWAYADYEMLMDFVEDYYRYIVKETLGTEKSKIGDKDVDWGKRWERIDYFDSFKQQTGIDLNKNPKVSDLSKLAEKVSAKPSKNLGQGRLIDLIYKKTIRPKIIQPSFLINHPVSVSPLAKRSHKNPKQVERIQVLAAGTEIGNGWSELNNPIDQEERFKQQQELRKKGDDEAQMYDKDFVEALEYGMPPAAGFGLSQRFFAVLVDKPIRETVFFPHVKPKLKGK